MEPRELWERIIVTEDPSERDWILGQFEQDQFRIKTVLAGVEAFAQEMKAGESFESALTSGWDVITRLHVLDVAGMQPRMPLEKAYAQIREEVVDKLREDLWERRHRRIRPSQSRPRFAGRYAVRFPAWIQARRDRPLVEND